MYKFTRDNRGQLDVIAARFLLNGSFTGWRELSHGDLQVCREGLGRSAFSFGTRIRLVEIDYPLRVSYDVRQECTVKMSHLLEYGEPVFFDLYLRFTNDTGGKQVRTFLSLSVLNKEVHSALSDSDRQ